MTKDLKSFMDKVRKGFNVNESKADMLQGLLFDDLSKWKKMHLVDWESSYKKLMEMNPGNINIAVLHNCIITDFERDRHKLQQHDLKKQEQKLCDYFSDENRTIRFIANYIDIDFEYPRAVVYEFRDVPSKKVLKELYEAAKALDECPEKQKLREHYKKYQQKLNREHVQNLKIKKITDKVFEKSVVFGSKSIETEEIFNK